MLQYPFKTIPTVPVAGFFRYRTEKRLMKEEKSVLGLATIRHNRGISLQQISEATKIGVRSLEAIERGDFRKLPGGIYTTSYIRQYARAIDYDESAILDYYRRQIAGESGSLPTAQAGTVYGGLRAASRPAES
jgi:hypothetical protein